MKNWLTSFLLFFALAGNLLAGTSVFSGSMENGKSAMECCQKKDDCDSRTISAARLCCALSCANPMPTAPGATFNFSPSSIAINDSILKQIALLFKKEKPVSMPIILFEREIISPKIQPKYIQHHSFLI